jgi:hypothetical protein
LFSKKGRKDSIFKKELISNCCGELPIGEICESNLGFCSNCNEGALFVEDIDCDMCNDNGYWYQNHYTIYCKYCNANPNLDPINPILEKGKE